MPNTRRPEYDSPEFRRMWLSSMTLREIADEFGAHLTSIRVAAMRRGLPPKSSVNAALRRGLPPKSEVNAGLRQ